MYRKYWESLVIIYRIERTINYSRIIGFFNKTLLQIPFCKIWFIAFRFVKCIVVSAFVCMCFQFGFGRFRIFVLFLICYVFMVSLVNSSVAVTLLQNVFIFVFHFHFYIFFSKENLLTSKWKISSIICSIMLIDNVRFFFC